MRLFGYNYGRFESQKSQFALKTRLSSLPAFRLAVPENHISFVRATIGLERGL